MSTRTVLQVVADGAPGGGTTAVLGLSRDLSRTYGWRVVFVSANRSYAVNAARELGLETFEVDFFTSRLDPRTLWHLDSVIKKVKPSIVHGHGARAGLPLALITKLRHRVPLVFTVHGFHFLHKPPFVRQLGAIAERLIAYQSEAVTYVSEGDRRIASTWGLLPKKGARQCVIYNGIESSDIDSGLASPHTYDIAFVGRMVEQKNPLFMIDLMKALADRNCSLAMVGGGELEDQARSYAAKCSVAHNITFLGPVDRNGALSVLRSSRIFVFPSLWEGLPIAPLEASYFGLPVVASRIPGTDEVVLDGHNGFTLTDFHPEAFAEKILLLLDNPELRSAMGANGQALVRERFQRTASSAKYAQVYEDLLVGGSVAATRRS